ncbi:MAG: hypothetical protein Fur003_3100 [Candidatus Dojkabacteria bacterium]
MYFVYILQAVKPLGKKNYYIGFTSNYFKRTWEHNSPFNIGYTRYNYWRVVYVEAYLDLGVAKDRERKLKQYGNVWKGVMDRVKKSSKSVSY